MLALCFGNPIPHANVDGPNEKCPNWQNGPADMRAASSQVAAMMRLVRFCVMALLKGFTTAKYFPMLMVV